MADPERSTPETEDSYGIPDGDGALDWSFVADRLRDQRTFWLATTRPDGSPHTRPVWGVYVGDTFHCGGGERTRWVRNLAATPSVAVHSESGTEVVILEGRAERVSDDDTQERVDDAYEEKYGVRHGSPVFAVRPERAFAWTDFPTDATRWVF
jgi:nitroimidazol reductase NimA-like FMN-containing flavoprotein (pyridoxamine 5'-phosphate oxidase superfamily)